VCYAPLQVDLGGCLAGGGPTGGCNPLHSAAVVLGLVDVLRGQMLSAVERVKAEVEHPAATRADNQVSLHVVYVLGPSGFSLGGLGFGVSGLSLLGITCQCRAETPLSTC
jgi:hypothetical protein